MAGSVYCPLLTFRRWPPVLWVWLSCTFGKVRRGMLCEPLLRLVALVGQTDELPEAPGTPVGEAVGKAL